MNARLCVPSCPFDNSPKGECLDAPINRTPSDPTCSLSPRSCRRGTDTRGWVPSGVTHARHGWDSLLSMWGAYISLSNISMTLRGPQRSGERCTQSGLLKAIGGNLRNLILKLHYSRIKKILFSLFGATVTMQLSCTYIRLRCLGS